MLSHDTLPRVNHIWWKKKRKCRYLLSLAPINFSKCHWEWMRTWGNWITVKQYFVMCEMARSNLIGPEPLWWKKPSIQEFMEINWNLKKKNQKQPLTRNFKRCVAKTFSITIRVKTTLNANPFHFQHSLHIPHSHAQWNVREPSCTVMPVDQRPTSSQSQCVWMLIPAWHCRLSGNKWARTVASSWLIRYADCELAYTRSAPLVSAAVVGFSFFVLLLSSGTLAQ